jgi:hypothetical protein
VLKREGKGGREGEAERKREMDRAIERRNREGGTGMEEGRST